MSSPIEPSSSIFESILNSFDNKTPSLKELDNLISSLSKTSINSSFDLQDSGTCIEVLTRVQSQCEDKDVTGKINELSLLLQGFA